MVEYDPSITEYPINSYVLFTPLVGRSDKLLPRHRGPYQVMDKTHSIYTIEEMVNGKRITTHIHNLRPFNYDPEKTMPLVVARHNEQEFVVESIVGHRGNRTKRSTTGKLIIGKLSEFILTANCCTAILRPVLGANSFFAAVSEVFWELIAPNLMILLLFR